METPPEQLKPEQMPAFPLHNGDVWGGMTLRDYFAAKALMGLLATPDATNQCHLQSWPDYAKCSFVIADAMLAARSASPT